MQPPRSSHSAATNAASGATPDVVLTQLSAAVLVLDPTGLVAFANLRAAEVLGRPVEQLVGARVDDVLEPLASIVEAARSREERRACCAQTRGDGARLEIGYTATPLACGCEEPSYSVVFQDVTQRERIRDERDRLLRLAAVSEVLPALLHELKNPLAAVTTAVEVLVEDLSDGPTRDAIHAVLGEIRRMKLTLEGVGSISRELGSRRNHPIDHAVAEVARVLTSQAKARHIELLVDVPTAPLLPLEPSVVRALVLNLVMNAIHATRDGRVRLSGRWRSERELYEIVVEDEGEGMSPEVLARCTELFYTTKARGSGIGLALVRRTVEASGGAIHLHSERGRGTRVTLELPAGRAAPPRLPPSAE
jgi:signal transduction histidine kinase